MKKSNQDHWNIAAKRILRYIKDTMNHGILYTHSEKSKLVGYSDNDYGGDLDDQKSTSGYLFHLGSIVFQHMKQNT